MSLTNEDLKRLRELEEIEKRQLFGAPRKLADHQDNEAMASAERLLKVEAFRWTGGPDQAEDPPWIVAMIKGGSAYFLDANTSVVKLGICDAYGRQLVVHQGQWVVRLPHGRFMSLTAEEYVRLVTEVAPPRHLTQEEYHALINEAAAPPTPPQNIGWQRIQALELSIRASGEDGGFGATANIVKRAHAFADFIANGQKVDDPPT